MTLGLLLRVAAGARRKEAIARLGTALAVCATERVAVGAEATGDHARTRSHEQAGPVRGGVRERMPPTLGAPFSTSSGDQLRVLHGPLTENEYHHQADACLDLLAEKLEAFIEDTDIDDADVEYSQGVLTMRLGENGTYVLNKQAPNQQIWLSSPVSGPLRYDFQDGAWVYHRDGRELLSQLELELQQLLGHTPALRH